MRHGIKAEFVKQGAKSAGYLIMFLFLAYVIDAQQALLEGT